MSLMVREILEKNNEITEFSIEYIDYACILSLFVGIIQFFVGFFRIGSKICSVIPEEAIHGFTAAASILIASTQLSNLVGIPKCQKNNQSCDFLYRVYYNIISFKEYSNLNLFISFWSLFILLLFKYKYKNLSKFGSLTVVIFGLTISILLHSYGYFVPYQIGFIPSGLPSPHLPNLLFNDLKIKKYIQLFLSAIPIAIIGYTEAITIARSVDDKVNKLVDEDQELIALSACNICTSLTGGYPVSGSFSRTAVNVSSGCRSKISVIVTAIIVMIVLSFLTPILSLLPKACVSSIIIVAILNLLDINEMILLYQNRKRHSGFILYIVVFSISLFNSMETGLLAGVILNFIINRRKKIHYGKKTGQV